MSLPFREAKVLFFNEWRAASRAASAAERMVSQTYMLYFNGKGKPPTPQEIAEAKRRRAVADDLFVLALRNWNGNRGAAGPLREE